MNSRVTDRYLALIEILNSYGVGIPVLAYDNAGTISSISWGTSDVYVVIEIKGDFLLLFQYNRVTRARKFLEFSASDFHVIDHAWATKYLSIYMANPFRVDAPKPTWWRRITTFLTQLVKD